MLDIGCWPGGWLQVAVAAVGAKGRVVGLDLAAVDPPLENENVVALVGDITQDSDIERILLELGGAADVLLSDAAPKLTGQRDVDRAHEEALLESIESRLPRLLRPGGDLLLKILEGPEAQAFERRLRALFATSRSVKVNASRKGTSERYLLARDFRGPA